MRDYERQIVTPEDDFEVNEVGTGDNCLKYLVALENVREILLNDLFTVRVKNALAEIDEALADDE